LVEIRAEIYYKKIAHRQAPRSWQIDPMAW